MNPVGTAWEVSSLSKKLPENWGIEVTHCLKAKSEQHLFEGINRLGKPHVVRIQPYSPTREHLWQTLSQYRLPHLGTVLDCRRYGETLFILEQYYEGESLLDATNTGKRYGQRHLVLALLKITQDLATLYQEEGLLHLDIKPENCRVDAYGNVTLLDFGAALTQIQNTDFLKVPQYGTPRFAAAERWEAPNQVGPPADLFSLTEVLKWWLAVEGIGDYNLWQVLSQWQMRREVLAANQGFDRKGNRPGLEAYGEFEQLLFSAL